MVAIIINIIAITMCVTACIIACYKRDTKWTHIALFLTLGNGALLAMNIRKAQEKENNIVTVIQDVKLYKVDSTIIINGIDTTKIYTITYWEKEE